MMLFEGWGSIFRVLMVGSLAYAGLVILLRVSGNRTLSKMNSFDLVITVAFGSALSTILTSADLALATGMAAIGLLVMLQFAITWLSVRSRGLSKTVKTAPSLLLENGAFRPDALRRTRVTEDEVRSAVRQHGYGDLERIAAVVMESDGSLSVISKQDLGSGSALEGLPRQAN
ncbi:MAG TPA: YetF domain-containing protein [Noviherbaspirillum sp.]|nr:YetF domain-containing protein [Noviherbaspirillum sp.]